MVYYTYKVTRQIIIATSILVVASVLSGCSFGRQPETVYEYYEEPGDEASVAKQPSAETATINHEASDIAYDDSTEHTTSPLSAEEMVNLEKSLDMIEAMTRGPTE